MAKFTDSNYQILLEYFTNFVKVATGPQQSYLIGPNRTFASLGGVDTTLYENTSDKGFIGHKFKIVEIEGNRFKMSYNGLDSTFSVATSAVNIGDEMYFRKDSFFHFWLSRQSQYQNYVNLEKTFSFFGKIWPVVVEGVKNTYSIEFEGMKDFAVDAIPPHNQTINLVEFIQTYFDRVQHDVYTMTKTLWSIFDPREVDIKWLRYISGIYGIEIDENLNEQSIREWVENLIYLLKRVGTYNAIYIIGKLFLGKTSNVLNVYERWGEWCRQVTGGDPVFRDYHFLEFYGIWPSGGAGKAWYDNFNPDYYPTNHIHVTNGPPPYPIHAVDGPPFIIDYEDVVSNGGFEYGYLAGESVRWTDVINGADLIETVTYEKRTGSYGVVLFSSGGDSYRYQDILVTPGRTYKLSFWVKGNGTDYMKYSVLNDVDYIIPKTNVNTGSTTTYVNITDDFIIPDGCFEIRLVFHVPSTIMTTPNIFLDDVSLTYDLSSCEALTFNCGNSLNFFDFTGYLLNSTVTGISQDTIYLNDFLSLSTQYFAISGQDISGDFKHCAGVEMGSSSSSSQSFSISSVSSSSSISSSSSSSYAHGETYTSTTYPIENIDSSIINNYDIPSGFFDEVYDFNLLTLSVSANGYKYFVEYDPNLPDVPHGNESSTINNYEIPSGSFRKKLLDYSYAESAYIIDYDIPNGGFWQSLIEYDDGIEATITTDYNILAGMFRFGLIEYDDRIESTEIVSNEITGGIHDKA